MAPMSMVVPSDPRITTFAGGAADTLIAVTASITAINAINVLLMVCYLSFGTFGHRWRNTTFWSYRTLSRETGQCLKKIECLGKNRTLRSCQRIPIY